MVVIVLLQQSGSCHPNTERQAVIRSYSTSYVQPIKSGKRVSDIKILCTKSSQNNSLKQGHVMLLCFKTR